MNRGKQQILFNYLPGKTFDFERVATIARVRSVRGNPQTELNVTVLLRKIFEDVRAWSEEFRPALRDDIMNDPRRFVLLDPAEVQAEMFPKVFWCQNQRSCGRVFDYTNSDSLPRRSCSGCGNGQLIQLRFIKIHRCGSIQPLLPPPCPQCRSSQNMGLDTRGSERTSNFRWVCRACNTMSSLFGGHCRECRWPDGSLRMMDIEVHRAGRTFYTHYAVLLNIPHRRLDAFLNLAEWPIIAGAKFLNLPEVADRSLVDFAPSKISSSVDQEPGLTGTELDSLLRRQSSGQISSEQLLHEMRSLIESKRQEQRESAPAAISEMVVQRTGVSTAIWERAGQEMLEAVVPFEGGRSRKLTSHAPEGSAARIAQRLGLEELRLVSDFPILTATYGYSRAEYEPDRCRLNPFPPQREHDGRFPIYVDQVQADGLLLSLNPDRVCSWLERNGFPPTLPLGSDPALSRRAYFVQLFDQTQLRHTISGDHAQARLAFGLLHTFSHLCVRQAALLCGLDRTSLSEYLSPRAMHFAIYCNHRFGATIGALTALFEQSLPEWLNAIGEARQCVYDPVCHDREGSCHACTHLAETSCHFFNLNLCRAFLFGGPDSHIGNIRVGYLDSSIP